MFPQQILGPLQEDVWDGGRPADVQQDEAALHHIWVRKHLEETELTGSEPELELKCNEAAEFSFINKNFQI